MPGETPAALDLAYVREQSFGNRAVETAMLELFLRQSMRLWLEFTESTSPHDWCDYARALKGSALSVGAKQVAELAAALEKCGPPKEMERTAALLADLEMAILKVNDCIRLYMKQNSENAY